MKRKHYLLDLFNGVEDRFVVEAVESREHTHPVIRKNRMILIAAVVALALLLTGCVAVFLRLQQRKIGEMPVTEYFDEYGNMVSEPEKIWYVASMSGFDNSPSQQASKEWNEFLTTYKPAVTTNESDLPNIPNQYEYTYQCWDQTMVDKLNEIAGKYSLELLGTRAVAQSWQREAAFEALGIKNLVLADASANVEYGACRVYPPYNFICDIRLTLTGENVSWNDEAYCEVYYLQSGYMAPNDTFLYDPESTQEWEYTTKDGTKVLLALSGANGTVLAQREDSTIVIQMDLAWQQGVFLNEDTPLPTKNVLEQFADCFDYKITTQAAPLDGLQQKFDAITDPNDMSPEDYEVPQYASYAEYLNENYLWPELVEYAFYDIDGDGEKDLITSYGDGFCINWLTIRNGQVVDLTNGMGSLRLCKGGIAEYHLVNRNMYYKILGPDPEAGTKMKHEHTVDYYGGEWTIDDVVCTAQEATDLKTQYQPVTLDWRPLLDFPMNDKGSTFADVIEKEGNLTGTALLEYYANNYTTDKDSWNGEMAWFELRDINDDEIEDLLLSVDGDKIDMAYTYKRGKLIGINRSFYLCENNVMHSVEKFDDYTDGVLEMHYFSQFKGENEVFFDSIAHYVSKELWKDVSFTLISEDEAQAVLMEHPHLEMNMRPISELIGR